MKPFWIIVVVASGVLSVGCAGHDAAAAPDATTRERTSEASREEAHEECEDEAIVEHAFSSSDDSDLVGFADNVFVGRVAKRIGSTKAKLGALMDSTQFSVEVLENVKGVPGRLDSLPVVLAHGGVEGAGEVLHLGGGLYGGPFVGDGYAFGFGVHAHAVRGNGASGDDYVLENVADGIVDGVFYPADVGA